MKQGLREGSGGSAGTLMAKNIPESGNAAVKAQ